MPHRNTRSGRPGILFLGIALSLLAAPPLQAQDPSVEAMAFPRQILTSYLAGDADRVWGHAAPMMREMWQSPAGLRQTAAEITGAMGAETGLLAEQLFDHPEGGGAKVYVRASRHAQAPEMFWVVIFFPAERKVQMIMPQPRQTIRSLFPQVRLP